MAKPLVSICIPTYNHASVIGDALDSAMAQDYVNLEFVVLDNASTDVTRTVVDAIANGDGRVRYVRNNYNLGIVGNFNACIFSARGDFIKFLCADDLLMPDCVVTMVDAFARNPEASLVAGARLLVDGALAPLRTAGFSSRSLRIDGRAAIRDCFFRGNMIGEPTAVMFRRQQALRGFRAEYPQLMDLEMWMHLLQSGGLSYIAQPLCKIRQHSQQATQQNIKSGIVLDNKRRLFREFHGIVTSPTFMDKLLWDIRMAITLLRTMQENPDDVQSDVGEVYFRRMFSWLARPVARLIWAVVGRIR